MKALEILGFHFICGLNQQKVEQGLAIIRKSLCFKAAIKEAAFNLPPISGESIAIKLKADFDFMWHK